MLIFFFLASATQPAPAHTGKFVRNAPSVRSVVFCSVSSLPNSSNVRIFLIYLFIYFMFVLLCSDIN